MTKLGKRITEILKNPLVKSVIIWAFSAYQSEIKEAIRVILHFIFAALFAG